MGARVAGDFRGGGPCDVTYSGEDGDGDEEDDEGENWAGHFFFDFYFYFICLLMDWVWFVGGGFVDRSWVVFAWVDWSGLISVFRVMSEINSNKRGKEEKRGLNT